MAAARRSVVRPVALTQQGAIPTQNELVPCWARARQVDINIGSALSPKIVYFGMPVTPRDGRMAAGCTRYFESFDSLATLDSVVCENRP